MEGLVIILAELLIGLLMPLFGALAGLLALIGEFLFLLITGVSGAVSKGPQREPAKRKPRSWRWLHIPAAIGAVAALAVLIANFFFFEPLLRFALDRIEEKTGYAVTFREASGSLVAGRLELMDAEVRRAEAEGPAMAVGIDELSVDVALLSLVTGTRRVEDLVVSGVAGTITVPPMGEGVAGAPRAPRRDFTVVAGRFSGIDLMVERPGNTRHRIEIASATVEPFRSSLAVFDLFFRSNLDARIDGIPLRVETAVIAGDGRRTEWHFDEVPAETLAGLTERAPLNWLSGGTITVHVEDEWALDDRRVDMDWSIVLEEVEVAAPSGAGVPERVAVTALAKALARSDGSASYNFTLALDREKLEASGSDDLSALWDALKDGLAKAVADHTGERVEGVKERIGKAGSALRDLLDPAKRDE